MEDNLDIIKITYAKNLNKLNFNSTLSLPIDSNVNIKQILDINSYLYDTKIECGNGKAVYTGRIGIKVLYIDTDNITNTISDSSAFSETYADATITSDCFINMLNSNIVNHVLSSDSILKINMDINVESLLYLNLALPNTTCKYESMIVKKSQIETSTISSFVNSKFEHTINIETKDSIGKILSYNAHFCPSNVSAYDEHAIVDGKLYSTLVYECTNNEESSIKEITDVFNIKSEISISSLSKDNLLDLVYNMNKSNFNITTEIDDDNTVVSVVHEIICTGAIIKNISLDIIDDMYSIDNEIELTTTSREYNKELSCHYMNEILTGEISLDDKETAIDEIISCTNIRSEITNNYIKDNHLLVEGVVSSELIYIDENKEIKAKQIELPFIINTGLSIEKIDCLHTHINISSYKSKVKRGTIIDIEYNISLSLSLYIRESVELIDSFNIGRQLDFSNYDYQIFLGKQNETLWELGKRVKINPDDLIRINKNLPLIMIGGEKIIIKR